MFNWLLSDWFGIIYLIIFIINFIFSIYLMFNYLRRTGIFQFVSSVLILLILSFNISKVSGGSNLDKIISLFNLDFYLNLVLYIFFILNLLRIVNLKLKKSGDFNEKIKRNK